MNRKELTGFEKDILLAIAYYKLMSKATWIGKRHIEAEIYPEARGRTIAAVERLNIKRLDKALNDLRHKGYIRMNIRTDNSEIYFDIKLERLI